MQEHFHEIQVDDTSTIQAEDVSVGVSRSDQQSTISINDMNIDPYSAQNDMKSESAPYQMSAFSLQSMLQRMGHFAFRACATSTSAGSTPDEMYTLVPSAPEGSSWLTKMKTFIGPGAMIAVGYMDPGSSSVFRV